LGSNHYLITALPALGDLGSPPPLTPAEMMKAIQGEGNSGRLVETVLLADDLLLRDSFLAGQLKELQPAVLTAEQARNEQPLPPYLAAERPPSLPAVSADAVWGAYFIHAAAVARQTSSMFLAGWVGWEVSLRNTLAAARAKALELEPSSYLVAVELGGEHDFAILLAEWAAADSALAAQRILDADRWDWIAANDRWFSFADDELAAYAARLTLLHRWSRAA